MLTRRRFTLSVLALAAVLSFTTGCDERGRQRVLLISIDGFRWDYRDRFDTPSLDAIAAAGVSAAKMQPGFPSKTFPNHFTLVTGLVPDHHGIVSNTMRDPAIPGVTFSMSNREAVVDPRWWPAEPIWTTLEKQGRKTAPLLWPGSEVPSDGVRPTHWMAYDDTLTDAERIALLVKVYAGPESKWPDFATLYWPNVDQASHQGGPLSPEVRAIAERVDGALGELHKTLASLGVLDTLNIIVVSDHGMSEQSRERVIYLEDYIDLSTIDIVDGSPIPGVYPKTLPLDDVYARLKGKHPYLQVYRRDEIPARLQFGTHPRVPPLLLLADEGWSVFPRRQEGRRFSLGAHGYDNTLESMQALFVAAGPSFKRGVRIEQIRSVDVYEVMCAILGITPNRNDGDPAVARRLLRGTG